MAPTLRIRLAAIAILCWVTLVISVYYDHVWAVRSALQRPVLGAATVLMAAQIAGFFLTRAIRWKPANWREAIPVQQCLGVALISYASLAMALVGAYKPSNVRWLLNGILLLGGIFLAYVFAQSYRAGNSLTLAVVGRNRDTRILARRAEWVWFGISAVAIGITLIGALAPEVEYDALQYYLFLPQLWLDAGHPVDVIWEINSLYPLTWELVFGCAMAMGGPIAGKLIHFGAFVTTAVLVYEISRRYALSVSPWIAVAIFVTVPTVMWEATTAYVDIALALCCALSVFAILRFMETKAWQWFAITTFTIGLAMATKHLGLIALGIAAITLWLRLWRQTGKFWRAAITTSPLLLSLLLPLPWYMRAWHGSGNPLFPELYTVFGVRPAERYDAELHAAVKRLRIQAGPEKNLLGYLTVPWDMTINAANYRGTLGPVFLLTLPGLVLIRRRRRILALSTFILLYFLVWVTALAFQVRYLLMVTPLLAVLAAAGYGRICSLVRITRLLSARRALVMGLTTVLVLNLPFFVPLHEEARDDGWTNWIDCVIRDIPNSVVFGGEPAHVYLFRRIRSYGAIYFINKHLPLNARVLSFSSEGDNYYLKRELLPGHFVPLRQPIRAPLGRDTEAIQALQRFGITHILFDKRSLPEFGRQSAIADPAVREKRYTLEFQDENFILYRL